MIPQELKNTKNVEHVMIWFCTLTDRERNAVIKELTRVETEIINAKWKKNVQKNFTEKNNP